MIRNIIFSIILLSQGLLFSQTRILDLCAIEPGENYPDNMPNILNWINKTIPNTFGTGLQASNQISAGFYSFALTSTKPNVFTLSGFNGIKLSFTTEKTFNNGVSVQNITQYYPIEFDHPIKQINSRFNPATLKYTPKEYFDDILLISRLEDFDFMRDAIRTFTQPENNESSVKKFIDDVNKATKANFKYPDEDSLESVYKIVSNSKKDVFDIVYETYIANDDNNITFENMEIVFRKSRTGKEVVKTIDEARILTISTGMGKNEIIEFPSELLQPVNLTVVDDNIIKFEYKKLDIKIDYKNKQLLLFFQGKLNQPAKIMSGKKQVITYKEKEYKSRTTDDKKNVKKTYKEKTGEKWVSVKKGTPIDNLTNFIFIIGEKSTKVIAYKNEDEKFELLQNKMP
ncbi:hypothetical protein [Flavobacterium suzhouense]|uniref:Uncharacterized protein n=1 Tax=Flavobacterium suzhouense TaxID=1529638 RepID=A0ABW5NRI2_9FLAO